MKLAVIGLGKLGAPYLAVLRAAGHEVVGVDSNPEVVNRFRSGRAPVDETGLQDLLDRVAGPIRSTTDVLEAVGASDAAFVVVPTPSRPEGDFDIAYVLDAVRSVGEAIRANGKDRYVLAITSTVMPGAIDGPIRQILEDSAGTPLDDRLGLVYNPEFIALGSVIHDMIHPDLVLIGETASWSGDVIAAIQHSYLVSDPIVARMSALNAEVAKLALNTYVTMKISFANMLGAICERLPGGNALTVTSAIGSDTRIGQKYFKPGASFGGPCFPRDNRALAALAAELGIASTLPEATDATNRSQAARLLQRLRSYGNPPSTVAVLGLSYKPETSVVEESFGTNVAALLAKAGYEVRVHDPRARDQARTVLGDRVFYARDVAEAVRGARAVLVTTPWSLYETLPELLTEMDVPPEVLFDCWSLFPEDEIGSTVVVRTGNWSKQVEDGGFAAAASDIENGIGEA